ncbi:hypothetical protein C8A05DRAFT_47870 [Staphylotrichum tortipilum]|uniref:GA4 desaturase n=1 Tax=Staphylotrichum tortipilum TaxID=2831512 RepID=A0AAN6RPE0_9PEZI|nr:hypothetical protein C8A05DRAFT_47870 [Staphylotrichum longicolle]
MAIITDDTIESTARTTLATLNYLLPGGPSINRRFVSAGVELNTGRYGPYPVTIRDGRAIRSHFTLARHGFTLLDAPTSITDFHDRAEVEAKYQDEVCEHVRQALGADLVFAQGWMLRSSSGERVAAHKAAEAASNKDEEGEGKKPYRHYGGLQPAAGEVHVDTEPSRQLAAAERLYARARPEGGPGFKRFVMSSFWRAFSPPPQDCPLAVCDARSVGDEEGTPNVLWVVDRVPETEEERLAEMDDAGQLAASIFEYREGHRWWYFSGMERGEVLLFKFHDSRPEERGGWRTPHTAFWDGSFEGARERESIECRTIAFWE